MKLILGYCGQGEIQTVPVLGCLLAMLGMPLLFTARKPGKSL